MDNYHRSEVRVMSLFIKLLLLSMLSISHSYELTIKEALETKTIIHYWLDRNFHINSKISDNMVNIKIIKLISVEI